jgi:hypothetical protein
MGNRFIRIYEEVLISKINLKDNNLELMFSKVISDKKEPIIRIILFSVEKGEKFNVNLEKLKELKEKEIIINTIHDDITEDYSGICLFYDVSKLLRERIYFETKEIDGLEFIFCV